MDEKRLKEILKTASILDVKDKIVLITQVEDIEEMISDETMANLAHSLKRAGAIEVILTTPNVTFETLTDKDLADIGLYRVGTQREETNGQSSSSSDVVVKTKSKSRKRVKTEVTH